MTKYFNFDGCKFRFEELENKKGYNNMLIEIKFNSICIKIYITTFLHKILSKNA